MKVQMESIRASNATSSADMNDHFFCTTRRITDCVTDCITDTGHAKPFSFYRALNRTDREIRFNL